MSLIIALDAGLRGCGFAVYDDGSLVLGCYVVNPERVARGPRAWAAMANAVLDQYPLAADLLVIEAQQYDGRMRASPGITADVMEIVGVTEWILAVFAGRVIGAHAVTPAEWKGAIPKAVCHARLMADLLEHEKAAIEDAGALTHNTLDAVALGLWAVYRQMERKRVTLTEAA